MLSASPRSSAENVRFTATRNEMHYCRVVGPRGLCRPLLSKGSQQTIRLSHPVRVLESRAKQGDPFPKTNLRKEGKQGRAPDPFETEPSPGRPAQQDRFGRWPHKTFGLLESAKLGPQTSWGPPDPQNSPKKNPPLQWWGVWGPNECEA